MEAEKEFKRVEQDLKKQGLSDEKAYREATIAAKNRELDIMAEYRKNWARIMGGREASRGALTQAQSAAIQQKVQTQVDKEFKDPRFLMDYKKQYPNFSDTQLRQQRAQEVIQQVMPSLINAAQSEVPNPYYSSRRPSAEDADIVDMRSR